MAACVSLLLYAAGLLLNDWFDLAEDRRERPHRPIPSGQVRPGAVAVAASVLVALAVAIAAIAGRPTLYAAVALGLAVLAYNAFAKRSAILGPITMGLCRGLSVLVGASALGVGALLSPPVLVAACGVAIYTGAVTVLAAGETRATFVKGKATIVLLAAAAWLAGLIVWVQPAYVHARWAMTAMAALTAIWVTGRLASLGGDKPAPPTVQRTIGQLIRAMVLVQATAVVSTGRPGLYAAAALIACFLINGLLARRFYAS